MIFKSVELLDVDMYFSKREGGKSFPLAWLKFMFTVDEKITQGTIRAP